MYRLMVRRALAGTGQQMELHEVEELLPTKPISMMLKSMTGLETDLTKNIPKQYMCLMHVSGQEILSRETR